MSTLKCDIEIGSGESSQLRPNFSSSIILDNSFLNGIEEAAIAPVEWVSIGRGGISGLGIDLAAFPRDGDVA